MPNIYHSEQFIPELESTVRGGITIVVHEPQEIEGLLVLSRFAGQPPETPIKAIAQYLKKPDFNPADWASWWANRTLGIQSIHVSPNEWVSERLNFTVDDDDDATQLNISLSLTAELWKRDIEFHGVNHLSLVVSVADPESESYPYMEWTST